MVEGTPGSGGVGKPPLDTRRYCSRCHPGLFRRINRTTLLQRTLLTWLGYFPWECVSCRRVKFFRDSGRKSSATVAA
jgi:hypothetical protein